MKTIYLRHENYTCKSFEYEILEDLKEQLGKNNISIGYGARIGDDARIGDGASIGYRARIGDGVKLLTGLYIYGSKHPVTYVGEGKLSIGCHCEPINWWIENYELMGKGEGYSESEILEYKTYIDLAKTFHENLTLNQNDQN